MESKGPSGPRRPLGIKVKVPIKKTEEVPTEEASTDITNVSPAKVYNPSLFGKTRPTASLGTPSTVATPSAISSATSAPVVLPKLVKPKPKPSLAPIPELPSAVSSSVQAPVPVVEAPVVPVPVEVPAEVPPVVPGVVSAHDPELLRMQSAIEGAISDVKYKIPNETAQSFMPPSFQGFSKYIQNTFMGFTLPMRTEADKTKGDACDAKGSGDMTMNLYQSFVREYMRQATPYRGLLVYHGLGSGKTCTSIAAAEALYGSHQKKIIVLTPVALKRNFIGELSFCGFKHFKLQNYWVKYDLNDESYKLFAIHNAKIPETYIQKFVMTNRSRERRVFFMPDFNKSTTPNYDSLPEWEKVAIKNQINATIEGNITFIGYTGVTVQKLKALLTSRAFDNAVVVIDEVHNLTRLMSNNIEKFLKKEPVSTTPWIPKEGEKYNRAILLYHLLSGAQNSKIIALSGTPIVNFNDEIGILGNLIHGYFHSVTMTVSSVDERYIKIIQNILANHPRVEYYLSTPQTNITEIFFTKVRDNYVKVQKGGKQIYMHYEESHPLDTIEKIYADVASQVQAEFSKLGSAIMLQKKYQALPLFPVERQEFEKYFIEKTSSTMINKEIFCERMTGLISYYRGAREEFMPRVASDEIVLVDMSDHAMIPYSEAREMEREQQKSKPKPATGFDEGAQAVEGAMSYRFRSRSLCNFAFPISIKRPFPQKDDDFKNDLATDELVADVKEGEPLVEEDSSDESSNSNSEDESSNSNSEDESSMEGGDGSNSEDSNSEEESNSNSENSSSNNESSSSSNESSSSSEAEESSSNESSSSSEEADTEESNSENSSSSNESSSNNSSSSNSDLNSSSNDEEVDCSSLPEYKDRISCTINKLKKYMDAYLKLDKIDQYSPKYKAMFQKIMTIDGSSLVYSQFRTLEGLGIFSIMMEANGFAPMELLGTKRESLQFSERTKKSLMQNPTQPRYIIYSGSESDDVRNTLKDIFNMDIAKLPTKIKEVLLAPNPNLPAVAKESHSYVRATRLLDAEEVPTNSYYATKNLKGELCKVFMITGAGAEGLSLRSVRAVHIMEPYWNNVRIQQVKGRAIRICSHSDLPEEERFVNIYTYIMKFKDTMKDVRSGEGTQFYALLTSDNNKTTDEHILQLSNEKEKLNNEFLHELKRAAVDCPLNIAENYTTEEPIGCYVLNVSDAQASKFLFDPRIQNHVISGAQGIAAVPPPVVVPMGMRDAAAMEDAVVPRPVAVAPPAMKVQQKYRVAGKEYNIVQEPNEKGVPTKFLYNSNTRKKVAYLKVRENGKEVPVLIKTRNNKNKKAPK